MQRYQYPDPASSISVSNPDHLNFLGGRYQESISGAQCLKKAEVSGKMNFKERSLDFFLQTGSP